MQFSGAGTERGWGLFPDGWAGEVLQFVSDVWNDLTLPKAARLEPRITKLLTGAIIARYEREERDWFCVPESPDWNEEGKEISRTDIRLYPPGKKRRSVSLILEGKRLNTPASRAAEYVGAGGMMCFVPTAEVPAKYAAGLPSGAMLGYVLDGDVRRAHSAVCKTIKAKRALLLLAADGEFCPLQLANSHEFHGITKHQRPDGVFLISTCFCQFVGTDDVNIDPRLHRIVAAQPYPLLFATISGAHLYGFGFPSPPQVSRPRTGRSLCESRSIAETAVSAE